VSLAGSVIYGHLWGTAETRALFDDAPRTRLWLDILTALAEGQAELGIIPAAAAEQIAAVETVDLEAVGNETRATGHSTLGLIRVVREQLGPEGAEWIYYGATVQDVTDTWTGLVTRRMLSIARRDLTEIERALHHLAAQHRDTVMLGRTHGQPGVPITFGF
jgi:adenylosuccinate lyase